ncbi:MAG: WG repeat-containing protein, partial [Verrucomicrobiales bacterium]|nr:WG repeat-containing protein [Verrucomicrobiales bacterium]
LHNEGGWFHIGTDGKPISGEKWEEAQDFAEGRAAVKRAGKWGYIGLDGAMITEPTYEEANDFSRGLAAVKLEGRWGFINPAGEPVIAAIWDEVTAPESEAVPGFYRWFGEAGAEDPPVEPPYLDVAQVKINGAAALIGRDGRLIIDPRLPEVPREGDAYLNGEDQMIVMRWGNGVGLEKREWYAWSDLAWLENDEPFQISPAFRWQVREQDYEKARELAKQTAAIWDEVRGSGAENRGARIRQFWKTDGLGQNLDQANWVLINQMGKPLSEGNWIRPKVNRTSDPFSGGLIHARGQNDKYGLIRKDGTTIMEPRFDNINWVAPKIAAVWNRDDGGLITAEGEWLFQDNETARIARFVRPTDSQFRHGLAVIEDVPQWGYARLNRTAPTQEKP